MLFSFHIGCVPFLLNYLLYTKHFMQNKCLVFSLVEPKKKFLVFVIHPFLSRRSVREGPQARVVVCTKSSQAQNFKKIDIMKLNFLKESYSIKMCFIKL